MLLNQRKSWRIMMKVWDSTCFTTMLVHAPDGESFLSISPNTDMMSYWELQVLTWLLLGHSLLDAHTAKEIILWRYPERATSNQTSSSVSDKLSGDRVKQVMEHIWKFQEFCNSMTRLDTDSYEYAYLKAIVLFSPGESKRSILFITDTIAVIGLI